ncbi:hypothetical protein TCON_1792 [Astathelohania contejeani]|uniref:Uncharacterized protein n=1 Tax=Astathelohania contejeani TaxID=164912 RepID=A0ABQ7HXU0_9MICR|nr:hypothetical protein TCON_1792 [Thelohania contejeani]
MKNEDQINEEIEKFLSMKNKDVLTETCDNDRGEINIDREDLTKLIQTLENLEKTYSNIHAALDSNDKEMLKGEILKGDVKTSLLCESLMKVLKEVALERNVARENEKKLMDQVHDLRVEVANLQKEGSKNESNVEFVTRSNEELLRIVRDQKERMKSYREKYENEKQTSDGMRLINKELEILKNKANEKYFCLEKELDVLKERIKEKDEDIKELKVKIKNKESEYLDLKAKNIKLEQSNEGLYKRITAKENSLSLCNAELSSLLAKEKRNFSEMESLKEKCSYYERLYKSISSQNDYLNSQLSKMINLNNIDKIEFDKTVSLDEKETKNDEIKPSDEQKRITRKYKYARKKIFKLKSECKNLKIDLEFQKNEMESVKKELFKQRNENNKIAANSKKMIDGLLIRMEELIDKNHEMKEKLYSEATITDFSIQAKDKEVEFTSNINLQHSYDIDDLQKEENYEEKYIQYDPLNTHNINEQDESFKTAIEYPTKDDVNKLLDRINIKDVLMNPTSHNKEDPENEKYEDMPIKEPISEEYYSSKNNKNEGTHEISDHYLNKEPIIISSTPLNEDKHDNNEINNNKAIVPLDISDEKQKPESNNFASETVKSFSTTSSLKNMIEKTEALKAKFDQLDKQLNEIKKSEAPLKEKLHDQIQAYTNYYYSDFLDVSNDSDIL